MRLRTLLLPVIIAASSSDALAAKGDPVQASAASVEASVATANDLAGSGVPVALGSAVIIAGSAAAIATGNLDYAEKGFDLGGSLIDAPLNADGSLPLSPDIIIAAPPPDVPVDTPTASQKGGQN